MYMCVCVCVCVCTHSTVIYTISVVVYMHTGNVLTLLLSPHVNVPETVIILFFTLKNVLKMIAL